MILRYLTHGNFFNIGYSTPNIFRTRTIDTECMVSADLIDSLLCYELDIVCLLLNSNNNIDSI